MHNMRVPPFFGVPRLAYASPPSRMMEGTALRVSTLLMIVGQPYNPTTAGKGLYGCPTIINNVETLSAVPSIIREGGDAYANRGTPKNGGTRMLCIAGHINKPGIYEVPLGMNMKKFIYEVAGGIPKGKKLKAVIPGGSS